GAAGAIAQAGRDDQRARAALLHPLHALVPALDHHARAEREDEGLAAILAGIELAALLAVIKQPAGVVHGDVAAGRGLGTAADDGVFVLQAGRGGGEGHGDSSVGMRASGQCSGNTVHAFALYQSSFAPALDMAACRRGPRASKATRIFSRSFFELTGPS